MKGMSGFGRVARAAVWPLQFLPEAILFGVALHLAVRFTVRDTVVAARYVFYIPTAIVAAACVVAIVFRLFQKRRLWIAAVTIAALGLVAVCAAKDEFAFGGSEAEADGGSFKIITWNIHAGRAGWEKVAARIRAERPDVVMLVEAYTSRAPARAEVWGAEFPEYAVVNKVGPLTILARGEMRETDNFFVGQVPYHASRYLCAEITIGGQPLNVILFHPSVDVGRDSGKIFGTLEELIEKAGDERPLILSGDFNTPPNSAYLDPIKDRLRSAFKAAGRGFAYSWPNYLPLLPIDQTYVNGQLRIVSYRIIATDLSDHYIQEIVVARAEKK
jgi:endonuclease/exonuclease/phosphatase (EEP) superfamily protein YafD